MMNANLDGEDIEERTPRLPRPRDRAIVRLIVSKPLKGDYVVGAYGDINDKEGDGLTPLVSSSHWDRDVAVYNCKKRYLGYLREGTKGEGGGRRREAVTSIHDEGVLFVEQDYTDPRRN